jgi:hypothetical protein
MIINASLWKAMQFNCLRYYYYCILPVDGCLWIEGVAWSAQRIPTAVNIDFLDPEPLLFLSNNSSAIITSHYFSEKSGSAGNRTRDLWICSQELWPLDHRRSLYSHTPQNRDNVTVRSSVVSWNLCVPHPPWNNFENVSLLLTTILTRTRKKAGMPESVVSRKHLGSTV